MTLIGNPRRNRVNFYWSNALYKGRGVTERRVSAPLHYSGAISLCIMRALFQSFSNATLYVRGWTRISYKLIHIYIQTYIHIYTLMFPSPFILPSRSVYLINSSSLSRWLLSTISQAAVSPSSQYASVIVREAVTTHTHTHTQLCTHSPSNNLGTNILCIYTLWSKYEKIK